jgi:hypothetical protein
VSAFASLLISRKLVVAFAAVIVVIFASSAIVYDRLLTIEGPKTGASAPQTYWRRYRTPWTRWWIIPSHSQYRV